MLSAKPSSLLLAVVLALGSCRPRERVDASPVDQTAAETPAQPAALQASGQPPSQAGQPDEQPSSGPEAAPPPAAETVQVLYSTTPGSFADVATRLRPAVVNIRTSRPVNGGPATSYPGAPPDASLGSGVIIDRTGYILTNHHFIAQASELVVVLASGDEVAASVVGVDPRIDIALLALETRGLPRGATIAPLGDSDSLAVGQWVLALGSPYGGELTASAGILTALGQRPALFSPPHPNLRGFLQTDAAIHAGNSGGPLVDTAGNVIGISAATDPHGARLGYAVPINQVKEIFEQLHRDGVVTRSWLGVFFHPVRPSDAEARGLTLEPGTPRGALLSQVIPGGPAAKAGLEVGDIVLRVAGNPVDHDTLPPLVRSASPGTPLELTVWRNGASRELTVVVEKMRE